MGVSAREGRGRMALQLMGKMPMPRCPYGPTTNRIAHPIGAAILSPIMGRMTKYQRIGLRVGISMSVGVLVAAIAIVVAWRSLGSMSNFRLEQAWTQERLRQIRWVIESNRAETKNVPQSWGELRQTMKDYHFTVNEDGIPLDEWGHPLLYSVSEGHPVITSYGRDGKPGGVGFDHDLSSDDKRLPTETAPTFVQFLLHPSSRRVLLACLACGVGAFYLSMITVNPAALHGRAILSLIVKLAFTILGAIFIALVISITEIPNPH